MLAFSLPCALVPLTDDRRRTIARIFRSAIRHAADLQTMDAAAREAERDRRQFSRQVDGEEGSLGSLMRLPDSFWQWLALEIANELGVPLAVERSQLLVHVATQSKLAMAKMPAARRSPVKADQEHEELARVDSPDGEPRSLTAAKGKGL